MLGTLPGLPPKHRHAHVAPATTAIVLLFLLLLYEKVHCKLYCSSTVKQLAAAAQVGDARAIRRKISHMKMRLMKAAKAGGRA